MKSARKQKTDGYFWADKLMDLANLAAAVLIFGQFVADRIYWNGLALGIILYGSVMLITKKLLRG